jgi:spore germination protein
MPVYVIKSGDTFWKLANRFGATLDELLNLNRLSNPDQLVVGQAILLPPITVDPLRYPVFYWPLKPSIQTLGYFHVNNLTAMENTLVNISPYLTYGALFEYPVKSDGAIVVSANTENAVTLLKQFQMSPLITLTNIDPKTGFDRDLARTILSTDTIRRSLIGDILALLVQYDLDGVNIDFESMYPEDRRLYTDFIAELTETLNSRGYLATIAAPAKSADHPGDNWTGTFDYAALGAVTNLIFLMAYDWGYPGGTPMAVAPINQVRKVIEYATSLISPQKIILGVPFYGYNWPLPNTPESKATTVNLVSVYDIAYDNYAAINYDSAPQSPWFQYTDTSDARHEVWFEDVRSVRVKYELAREFNLAGVGFWSSRNEPYGFSQNWPILSKIFNIFKYAFMIY